MNILRDLIMENALTPVITNEFSSQKDCHIRNQRPFFC